MRRTILLLLFLICSAASLHAQQKLSVHWEELTAADFTQAIEQSKGTCILPIGILEKHGPHLPLGTDLLNVRYASLHAAEKEFAVVFPEYYFGQIFEAKHEPGTIAYSRGMELNLLLETTDEMARNGCKKVLIVNGHGGNESLLPFFAQSQLEKSHDYVVYIQSGERQAAVQILAIIRELWVPQRRAPLRLKEIANRFIVLHAQSGERVTSKWIGWLIRRHLGLKPYRTHGVYVLFFNDSDKLDGLCRRFGLSNDVR